MLKQNDTLFVQYPIHLTSGSTSTMKTNWMPTESGMNRYFSNCSMDHTTSMPIGYNTTYAEIEGMSDSGLASSTGISGTGSLTASATMLASISSTSNGSGTIATTAYLYGQITGSISSNINVGSSLSANSVAGAVLGAFIDESYSLQQVIRIIASVAAGSVSGGPNNPSFANLSNTHSVVSGSVDANGNRTSVVINPS